MKIADNFTGLNHLGLPTESLEKTVAFYEGLGFEVAWQTAPGAKDGKVAFLRQKGLVIETYECAKIARAHGAWDHVALEVGDIEDAFKTIRAGGYDMIESEIQFLPFWPNGVRFFNILGPSGEKVEFLQML